MPVSLGGEKTPAPAPSGLECPRAGLLAQPRSPCLYSAVSETLQFTCWEDAKPTRNLCAVSPRCPAGRAVLALERVPFVSLMCILLKRYQVQTLTTRLWQELWVLQNGLRPGSPGPPASGCQEPGLVGGHCFMACPLQLRTWDICLCPQCTQMCRCVCLLVSRKK